jgi:hypothetical protein
MRRIQTLLAATWLTAGAALLPAAPASADNSLPPLPPAPGYPPPGLLVPGSVGAPFGYQNLLIPIPPNQGYVPYDAAGVGVGTNSDQTSEAMPGSRPGLRPTRVGPFGPTPGIRVTSNSDGSVPSSSPTQAANPLSNQPPFATSVPGQAGN